MSDLKFLGSGALLIFMFIKTYAIVMLLALIIYGIFALTTNLLGGSTPSSSICSDDWCRFINNSTNNNTTIKMYVNGSLHAQGTYSNSIYYSPLNKPLTLGSVSGAPTGNSLDGSLDEFLFYNRALSPTEVTNIFSGITTGIHSSIQNEKSEITLYPNPTSSILNIEVKEQTLISIVNVLGEVIKAETINGVSTLDVSDLNAGVYFIQDSKSGKAIKFIKQ